jgi:hypothetical protein
MGAVEPERPETAKSQCGTRTSAVRFRLNPEGPHDHRKPAMPVLETLKKLTERASGLARPTRDQIEDLVRLRKANVIKFKDDGVIPNHGYWPFVFYRGVVALPDDLDPAAIMEDLFELNGRGDSWRRDAGFQEGGYLRPDPGIDQWTRRGRLYRCRRHGAGHRFRF